MAEPVTRRKSARVERRGRFTITDIEPDSPAFACADDAPPQFVGGDGDADADGHDSGDDESRRSFVRDSAAAVALMASERISPFGSAVFERGNGAVRVVDASGLTSADGTANTMVTEIAVSSTFEDASLASRAQPDLKVERKGRFTIIELASDTPRDKEPAEEFSTTTSISVTSTQVSQANALSSSPLTVNPLFGSSPKDRVAGSTMLSRASSEILPMPARRPSRSIAYSADGLENVNMDHSFPSGSPIERASDMASATGLSSSLGIASSRHPVHEPPTSSPILKPALAPSLSCSGLNPLASSSSSVNGRSTEEKRRPVHELGANRRHLASRQKAITISAEQFIQQQQTIASLIRQQQELKQLIGVLQEQQHHLMDTPLHLTEFTLDQAHSEAKKDSMREVQIQVTTLSRANDALQDLLSEAEEDAHERTMEIECLSNENNELRHRSVILERRYNDERKRSYTLEQELNRTKRALQAARQKNEQQQQQQFLRKYQHKLLSRPQEKSEEPVLSHAAA